MDDLHAIVKLSEILRDHYTEQSVSLSHKSQTGQFQ